MSGKVVIPKSTAILAIMADAAYAAHPDGDGRGRGPSNRINNHLAEMARSFPGLAEEIEKYTIVQSNIDMFSIVNDTDEKLIISFRGTNVNDIRDLAHDFVIFMGK